MEKLKIDVDNRSPFLKRIYLRQGDGGIQTVLINVVSGDDPVDCTGYTVKFKANLSDGKLVTGEAEPKDLTNGEYTYTFKSAESSVYGDVRNAYFQLYDEAGNSISGSNVLITVEKGVDITQEQADGYVSELDKIIEAAQGKADELAEFAEEEKDKITSEVTDVSEFAESQKEGMLEITADVSSFADEQKATMADKTGEVANYGDMQKVAMLNKRLEIEQTGNQEKAKILAVLPDVKSSIAEQTEQIADLQESLSDVSLHQTWMTGENGEGFSRVSIGENLLSNSSNFNSTTNWAGNEETILTIEDNCLSAYKGSSSSFRGVSQTIPIPDGAHGKKFYVSTTAKNASDSTVLSNNVIIRYLNASSALVSQQNLYEAPNLTTDFQHLKYEVATVPSDTTVRKMMIIFRYGKEGTICHVLHKNFKLAFEDSASIYTPSPTDDPINCFPKYVGFGIKNSDNYQDYRWILNPEWAMANAIYGTEITTLKDQLADIQAWIQAHS